MNLDFDEIDVNKPLKDQYEKCPYAFTLNEGDPILESKNWCCGMVKCKYDPDYTPSQNGREYVCYLEKEVEFKLSMPTE